jgi:hypothetical protein
MPRKFLVEMVMDRRAACMTYQGSRYTDGSAIAYLMSSREKDLMHPQTLKELRFILEMLRDKGEKETFHYIKHHILKGKPFPWEENS